MKIVFVTFLLAETSVVSGTLELILCVVSARVSVVEVLNRLYVEQTQTPGGNLNSEPSRFCGNLAERMLF